MSDELLAVGKVVKAFGIRGHLVVQPMTDAPARFKTLRTLYVGADADDAVEAKVELALVDPRGVRIKFHGVSDRTAAEAYVGRFLFVDTKHRMRIPKGTHYVHDVIGMNVVDEVRGPVGVLQDVLKYPAHDVYVVTAEGREILIPAVKEFVRRIDVPAKQMTVRLIDGMIDANQGETA